MEEVPYSLLNGNTYYRLSRCLCNIDIFYGLYNKQTKFEFKQYWLKIMKDYDVVQVYKESLQEYETARKPSKKELSQRISRVAKLLKEMLQYDGAKELQYHALHLNEELYGKESEEVAKVHFLIAQLYWNQGKWSEAKPHCEKSIMIREKVLGISHIKVGKCLVGMGEMEIEKNALEAKSLLERALDIFKIHYGKEHQLVSRILHDLATVCDSFGQHQQAVELHFEAIRIREKTLGSGHPQLGTSYEVLGITYKLQGENQKAVDAMLQALQIHINFHGEFHPSVAACYEWVVLIYNHMNKPFKADEYEQKRIVVQQYLDSIGIQVGERIVDY